MWELVKKKLLLAGYDHALSLDGIEIDMHGLALTVDEDAVAKNSECHHRGSHRDSRVP
jgi:hypothetical protein